MCVAANQVYCVGNMETEQPLGLTGKSDNPGSGPQIDFFFKTSCADCQRNASYVSTHTHTNTYTESSERERVREIETETGRQRDKG